MAYPTNEPSGNYVLRDYDFATNDTKKLPMDEYLFKNGYKNEDESKIESVPDAHNQNWLFDLLHRNLKYTFDTAKENKRLLETKVATPTSIGQVKIGYGLSITSNGVLSVDKGIAEDANIISYDLPVGSYMLWCGKNTPEYFIEPDGRTLLRSSYPDLWRFAQENGLVGTLFGNGDGVSTFTVTDIRGNFISIVNNNSNLGRFTDAGLPNIVASAMIGGGNSSYPVQVSSATGAFYTTNTGTVMQRSEAYFGKPHGIGFNASRSNPIYGRSGTVTPANWGLKLILKAQPTPPVNVIPTGTILDYTGKSAPNGYIIANGAELSRTTFSKLYNWALSNGLIIEQSLIPDTPHAQYGTGDGSTTFTIPDLRGVFKRNADLASGRGGTDVGLYQADSLNNFNITIPHTGWGTTGGNLGMVQSGCLVVGSGENERTESLESLRSAGNDVNAVIDKGYEVISKNVSTLPILKY